MITRLVPIVRITMILGALIFGAVDLRADSFFYTNGSGQLFHVNSDGSNKSQLFGSNWGMIAVDDLNGHLYLNNWSTNSIVRMNLDGSNQTTIITGVSSVASIEVDPIAGKIFYTSFGGAVDGVVRSANLDGSNLTTIFTLASENNSAGIALDVVNQRIYVADSGVSYSPSPDHARISSIDYNGENLINLYNTYTDWHISVNATGSLFSAGYYNIRAGVTNGAGSLANIYSWFYPPNIVVDVEAAASGQSTYFAEVVSEGYGYDRIASINANGTGLTTLVDLGTNFQLNAFAHSASISSVPEPSTQVLLTLGIAGLGMFIKFRARSRAC